MPSPVGHGLAGLAIALAGDRSSSSVTLRQALTTPATLVCVALAMLPDADLLIPGFHRRATHSIAATIAVTIVAIVVTGWVNRSRKSSLDFARDTQVASPKPSPDVARDTQVASPKPSPDFARDRRVSSRKSTVAWPIVVLCAAAHASHIVLDWLGADLSEPAGLQALWPWSDRFYMSGWNLFPQIERRNVFSATSILINLNALVWELLLTVPFVLLAWKAGRAGRAGGAGVAGRAGTDA